MKHQKSLELYQRAKRSHAGGVSSDGRDKPLPIFYDYGKGSRLFDVDGNEYIDYNLARGPLVFGHSPAFLLENVTRRMQRGQMFAGMHELEITVSEKVQSMVPCAELVRFASSGSEAAQAALRVARGYTGRSKFVKFEGFFHGWLDSVKFRHAETPMGAEGPYVHPVPVPESGGMSPSVANDIIVIPFNDVAVLRKAVEHNKDDLAAIIVDPGRDSMLPPYEYMAEMRRLCDEHGIVLIFDEVITGFRVAPGGAQELLGVTPDLAIFAKALGGGFPVSALAGRRGVMSVMEDGTVHHGGTANANMMSMAAAEASLNKLTESDGAAYRQLHSTTERLAEGLRGLASKHEFDIVLQWLTGTLFMVFSNDPDVTEVRDYRTGQRVTDVEKGSTFNLGMMERGVRWGYGFVSTAHTEEDIEQTLAAADDTFASMR
ncbi:MAG: aspartate aminotransferase family protein [Chloroflexi bacterium]|nr:aspartate aminotransferase family protein [Chloroflexota bacterium]